MNAYVLDTRLWLEHFRWEFRRHLFGFRHILSVAPLNFFSFAFFDLFGFFLPLFIGVHRFCVCVRELVDFPHEDETYSCIHTTSQYNSPLSKEWRKKKHFVYLYVFLFWYSFFSVVDVYFREPNTTAAIQLSFSVCYSYSVLFAVYFCLRHCIKNYQTPLKRRRNSVQIR